jgi:pilus assembly protein CpaF
MFTVIVAEKGGGQRRLEFDEDVITIGRVQGNQIVLPRGNVSKQHARLECRGGEFRLTDLNSTNGTYINGRRITETALVVPGDKVYIGEFIVGFEATAGASEGASPQLPAHAPAPAVTAMTPTANEPPSVKPTVSRQRPAALRAPQRRTAEPTIPTPVKIIEPIAAKPLAEEPQVFSSVAPAVAAVHAPAPPARTPAIAPQRPSPPQKPAPTSVAPQAPSASAEPASAILTDARVEQLLEVVARQIKRIEIGKLPARLDEGTAGKVRIVLAETVGELVAHGKLPPTSESAQLLGRAFRAAVDIGPLAAWLDDPEIKEIRISSADAIIVRRTAGWSPAVPGFVSEDALAEALRCLGSGVLGRDEGGVPGLVRYRLEDGAMVLAALPPAASSGASASIYKNISPRIRDAAGTAPNFTDDMRAALEKAVAAHARIAIVGSALPYRLSVAADIVRLIPAAELIVGAEDIPLLGFGGSRRVGLAAHGLRKGETRAAGVGSLLPRAVDLHPDWIAACGAWWDDVPELLACAAGRTGFIAELPLAAERGLDKELALGLTAAGLAVSAEHAASIWINAFDCIAVADPSAGGDPIVRRLLKPGVMGAEWSPKIICERAD